jgi:hypothetical protein|tara:strand:- start:422 stop:874 length:453 start_codon:yes stop_codon:yes gene_type:complete
MRVVNSDKEELPPASIIAIYVDGTDKRGRSTHEILMMIAKEGSLENSDMIQFGNTVFLGHTGTTSTTKMIGRALNVDTARNFVANVLEYIRYLQDKGITHYATQISDDKLLGVFKIVKKKLEAKDSAVRILPTKSGGHAMFVNLGREFLG